MADPAPSTLNLNSLATNDSFCLILGDSTAIGTAQALAAQGIRCEVHARVGAGSAEIERRVSGASPATVALIALGSNDAASPALATNLVVIRRKTTAVRVAWLAPYDLRAASIVTSIAARFGDMVIPLRAQPSRDGIHPVSYRPVATSLRWGAAAPVRAAVAPAPIARATVLMMSGPLAP
uniref:hypothetical protein n=1 Tax=Sphingomonas panni TaxID=237612 RepID=UPI0037049A9F